MDLTDALPQDELLLARLTAAKLAKVLHGLMSVGTASLETDCPTDFLTGRDKTPLGFLEVLRCVGVKSGHADKVELLRGRVRELSDQVSRFHRLFIELAQWRTLSPQEVSGLVDRLGDSYSQVCQQLGQFCSLLGMEADFSAQAQQDRHLLEAFFQTASVR